jgi:predicted transcriptional regulator
MPRSDDPLLALAARIVSAHVGHNETPARAVPDLIRDVYRALKEAAETAGAAPPARAAVPARQTVFDDHVVCMECGLRMKMLKRHLQTVHNETPSQYRAKWNLAADYPMVARQYASLRSSLAMRSGLGKRHRAKNR